MDDLLIFSKDLQSHYLLVKTVLSWMKEQDLYIVGKVWVCEEEDRVRWSVGYEKRHQGYPKKADIFKSRPSQYFDHRYWELPLSDAFLLDKAMFLSASKGDDKPHMELKWCSHNVCDFYCGNAFEKLENVMKRARFSFHRVGPSCSGLFWCLKNSNGSTWMQVDGNERAWVVAIFSNKSFDSDMSCTVNDRDVLGVVKFLCPFSAPRGLWVWNHYRYQALLRKAPLNQSKPWWQQTTGRFGMFGVNLRPGKIYGLCNTLSRAQPVENVDVDDVKVL